MLKSKVWTRLISDVIAKEENYELSIFSYHGTGAVSLSSTVLW